VRPGHEQFIEPSKRFADVIFPQGGLNEPALELLLARVREFTDDRSPSASRVLPTT
jgi:uridine kinase